MNTCADSFRKKNSFITSQKGLLRNINIVEDNKKMLIKQAQKNSFGDKYRIKKSTFKSPAKLNKMK